MESTDVNNIQEHYLAESLNTFILKKKSFTCNGKERKGGIQPSTKQSCSSLVSDFSCQPAYTGSQAYQLASRFWRL